MTLIEGALGVALLKLFSGGSAAPKAPPPPPTTPDAGGGIDAKAIGGYAGTAVGSLIGLIGGGGGSTTAATAATGTTVTAVTTGASTGAGAGAATAEAGVGGTLAATIGFGGALSLGWVAIVVLQFVVMNIINDARNRWLRWRDQAFALNQPFQNLHYLELELVRMALHQLGLGFSEHAANDTGLLYGDTYSVNGEDPRLTVRLRSDGSGFTSYPHWRTIIDNPFPGTGKQAPLAAANWYFLQMAARLVASRYVVDLGTFGRSFVKGWFNQDLGNSLGDSYLDVWNYPLVGGGQPDLSYADLHAQLRALGDSRFPIDGVLQAAHLAALLHCASLISGDTTLYPSPFDYEWYAAKLYGALGLTPQTDGVTLAGGSWFFDVRRYAIPSSALYLDITALKEGKPLQPFLPGTAAIQPPFLTALVALP